MFLKNRKLVSCVVSLSLITTSIFSQGSYSKAMNEREKISGEYTEKIDYTFFKSDTTAQGVADGAHYSRLILEGTGNLPDLSSETLTSLDEQWDNQPWISEFLGDDYGITKETASTTSLYNVVQYMDILIGDGITGIGKYTFANYRGNFRLGKNITELPEGCFAGAAACNIYIYGNLTSVDSTAFSGCKTTTTKGNHIYVASDDVKKLFVDDDGNSLISGVKASFVEVDTSLAVDDTPLRIAIAKGLIEKFVRGEDGTGCTPSSWAALLEAVEEAKTALENGGLTDDAVTNYTKKVNDALDNLVSVDDLEKAIEKANDLNAANYTDDSWNALQAAIDEGKAAIDNESITKSEVDTLVNKINTAIENLVKKSLDDVKAALEDVVEQAKALVESDYTSDSWSALQTELEKKDSLADVAEVSDVVAVQTDIETAIKNLEVQYPELPPLAKIVYNDTVEIVSGTADDSMAGATSAVIKFDCASDTSWNPYASVDISWTMGSGGYKQFVGNDSSYASGTTGWELTLDFSALKAGDKYTISGITYSWDTAADGVYLVQSVTFLDKDGNQLKKIQPTPTSELEEALATVQEKLDGIVETDYDEKEIEALKQTIESAKKILAQDTPLPSQIKILTESLETSATTELTPVSTDDAKKTLEDTISKAEALNESKYTEDSWKALQSALTKANTVKENADALLSEVEASNKALEDAIANLVEATPDSPTPPSNNPDQNQKPGTSTTSPTPGNSSNTLKKGSVFTKGKLKYKVTNATKGKFAVAVQAPKSKTAKSLTIPATVKQNGASYKVTSIAANAFKNCKKLKKITIGKNVTTIGKNAFKNAKVLKKITVKTKTLKSVGKNALKGIHKKAVIKVPKAKLKKYKKLFKGKGQKKTVKIKK